MVLGENVSVFVLCLLQHPLIFLCFKQKRITPTFFRRKSKVFAREFSLTTTRHILHFENYLTIDLMILQIFRTLF